jgi:hypothetical protein
MARVGLQHERKKIKLGKRYERKKVHKTDVDVKNRLVKDMKLRSASKEEKGRRKSVCTR